MSFLRFLLFLGLNFPKRKRCFSFWFSDVYSQMSFVYICLKYITFRQILLDTFFPFSRPYENFMDTIQDSRFIRSKTDEWRLGIRKKKTKKKQTIFVFLKRGITDIFVIKNQLSLKLWIFQSDMEKTVLYWSTRHFAGKLFVYFFLNQLVFRRFFRGHILAFFDSLSGNLLTEFYCTALDDIIPLLSDA